MNPAARGRNGGLRIRNLVAAVGLLGLALISGELAGQVPSTNKGLPVLTRIADIRRLTRDQASLGYPVLISAVVTYYYNEEGDFFIADREESIYVDDAGTDLHLHSGQSLQIEGYTDPGGYAPQIVHPKIRILGTGRLPRPQRVTFGDLISGKFDSQWVDLDGIVQSATQKGGRVELAIAGEGGRLSAMVSGSLDPRFLRLVDTKVRLQGACVSLANPKRQIFGTELNVPSLEYVHILEAGPPDPFQLPVRPIMTVLQFLPHSTYSHRIRIQGTVTMQRRGTQLYLQDQADSIYVDTSQPVDLKAGDRIDVAGFPEAAGYSPVLRKAVVRKIGSGPPPEPQSLTVAALRKFDNDTGLVRFQARLLERVPRAGDQTLILQDRGFVFNADLETIRGAERLASLKPGSLLQITGVCLVSTDENHVPQAFRILLRSGEDVVVLRSPSWWTLKRTLWGVGVLAAFILAALGWVVLLRRQVREQTATIREWGRREAALRDRFHELFENANDIVFTCGLRGHITSLNLAGERILGYSRPEAIGQNILEWVAPQYRLQVEHIIQSGVPQQAAQEIEILTKDGRRVPLEVSLRPIYSGAYPVAVQGIARDITERKRAEEQLRKLSQAVEQSPSSVIITDTEGRIEYVNPQFARLTGYALEEAVGNKPSILKSGETPPEVYRELWGTITSGREWRGEFHNKKKNGELYWESASVTSIKNSAGAITHFLAVKEDITERKRAERVQAAAYRIAELANSTHRLEDFYRSTHELVNTLMPAKNFYIALYDAVADVLSFSYYVDEQDEAPPPRRPRKGFTEYILRTGKPLLAPPEVLQELVKAGEIESRGTQPHDRVGVPLRLNGEPIGVLVVQSYSGGIRYGEEEKNALQFISEQVAMAVSRKRAEEERQFLQIVTQAIGASEDLTSGLRATVQALCEASGWVLGQVWIPCADGTHLEVTPAWYGNAPGSQEFRAASEGLALLPGEGVPGRAWSTKQRVWFQEGLFEDVTVRRSAASALGLKLGVAIPVLSEGKVVAVMEFFATKAQAQDQSLLEVIAVVGGQLGTLILRKRAEEALRESEEKFRGLFQGAAEGILVSTIETKKFVYANPAVCRMLGYTEEELVHLNVSDIHPQQELERVAAEFMAQARGEKTLASAIPCLCKDGATMYADINASRLVVDGRDCIVGFFTDITERKRAEEAAREAHEALRTLVQASPVAILALNPDASVAQWNPAAEHLFGWTASEVMGRPIPLVHEEEREHFQARFAKEQRGEESGNIEVRAMRKDGTALDILLSSAPRRDGRGDIVGTIAVIADISDRKRAEVELRKAKEAAEAATRAKSAFLANMSHEIRTPMNGIMGMTELALDTHLDAEQREYLQMVKSSADSLLTVINDVLDFSKIEAGKFELDLIEFNLRDNLEQTIRTLALRAHQKGLELTCEVRPGVPERIIGDPARLRQIIINLVGNAIKFTSQGEVSVRVDLDSHLEDAVGLHFEVIDTGIGIPQEKQKVIFEAFAQADGSSTRKYGGTGLGLTISKQLVEMMHGHIWVESEVGRGSVFHFSAPFPLGKTTTPLQPTDSITLAGIPVLVVDDNATNRRILDDMLSRWRMKPTLASGGHAALDLLRKARDNDEPFPLVLTDAHMPEMDGFALAHCIRQDSKLDESMIMMLTSGGQRGDAERCRELGIAAYLTKPVRQVELREAIMTVLGAKPHAHQESGLVTRHSLRERRRGLRVLLAEDNAVNQQLVVGLLEKRGHTVVIAPNGRVALEELEKSNFAGFDVVLMDIQMPEMGGYEATTAIREKEMVTGEHLPIIAMTAHALKGDRERCLASGMDGYVSKPIQVGDFFAAIEAVVQAYPGSSSPELPQEILNKDTLLERVEGDVALLGEMAAIFLQECPKHLSDIRQAVASCDSAALQTSAHTLKGSVSNFTAHKATQAALRLEMMGRDGDLTKSEPALLELEKEIERLKPVLEVFAKGV